MFNLCLYLILVKIVFNLFNLYTDLQFLNNALDNHNSFQSANSKFFYFDFGTTKTNIIQPFHYKYQIYKNIKCVTDFEQRE